MFEKLLELVGLPSPTHLLVLLVLFGAVGTAAFKYGDTFGFDRAETARAHSQDAAIAALDKQLDLANQRAVAAQTAAAAAANREAAAKATLETTLKGIQNAPPVPATCLPADLRMRINNAIDAINSYLASTGNAASLSGVLPAAPAFGLKPK